MSDEANSGPRRFDDACRFIIKLGKAAHGYGPTAGRLEAYRSRMTA